MTGDIRSGPQKIHITKTPRIGGFAIYITLILALIIFYFFGSSEQYYIFNNLSSIVIISFPVIIVGLAEDIFKDISIFVRFSASIFAGIIAYFYEITLSNSNIIIIDEFLNSYNLIPLLMIIFFVGSINSINLIDGVNGLAGLSSIIILITLSILALENNDYNKYHFTLLIIGIILGFLLINWLTGAIFLGDSGAYLLGTILAFITCKILYNNNLPIFNILTLFLYPIWEISYTILRRFYNNKKIIVADNKHLHSIVHIIITKVFQSNTSLQKNSLTTLFLLPFIVVGPITTLFLNKDPEFLVLSFIIISIFISIVYNILCNKLKLDLKKSFF